MDKHYYLEFDFINNPEGTKDNTITKYYSGSTNDLVESVILKNEATNKYMVFWSFERFKFWVNLVAKDSYEGFLSPDRGFNFHEVCTVDTQQRMRFDIDATREVIDSIPFEAFGDYIAIVDEEIKRIRAEVYDSEVNDPSSIATDVMKVKKEALDMYKDHNWRKLWALILILKDNLLKAIAVSHNMKEESYQRRSRNKNFLHTLSASDSKKYSLHLVLENIIFKNYAEVAHMAKIVFDNLNEDLLKIVDRNVYKSTQNFRILGAAKFGSKRVMKYCYPTAVVLGAYDTESIDGKPIVNPIGSLKGRIYTCDNYFDMLKRTLLNMSALGALNRDISVIPNYGRYWRAPEIAPAAEKKPTAKLDFTTNDRERAINLFLTDKELSAAFYPRPGSVSNRVINFNRIRASYCDLCSRVHEKDNTLFLTLHSNDGGVYVYRKCLKAPNLSVKMGCIREKEKPIEITRNIAETIDIDSAKKYTSTKFDNHVHTTRYSEDKMRDFELKPTLVVNAQMKMGKTKALIKYIEKHFTDYSTIRIVSFRRTFTNALAIDLPTFQTYSDLSGDITELNRRVIIQVESLHRLKDVETVDLVVLDEFESILDQFSSPNHRELHSSFAMFYKLLNTAKYIVCMDANLQDRSYRTLQNMRPQHPIYYHNNQFLRASEDIYIITQSDRVWIENLLCKLQEEKRIVIPTNSLKFAKSVEALIKQTFPSLRVMAYNSETSETIKNEHFSEVSKHWVNYDVLIYTPTLSAGVSFELEHYDCLFGYFTDTSCSVEVCRQMLGRVRIIGDLEYYLCLRGTGFKGLPTDINRIREYVMARRLPADDIRAALPYYGTNNEALKTLLGIDADAYFNTPLAKLLYENTRINNLSKNEFTRRFISQVVASGAQQRQMPRRYSGVDYEKVMSEVIEKLNDQDVENIYCAPDITEAEYEQYMKMIRGRSKTIYDLPVQIQRKVERYQFKAKYDMNNCTFDNKRLDKTMIAKLLAPDMKRNYRNLVDITCLYTVDDALETMRDAESKHFADAVRNPENKQADDMTNENKHYKYLKHKVAIDLMKMVGVSFEGTYHTTGKEIFKSVSENLHKLELIMANMRAVRSGYNDAYSVKCVNIDNLRKMLDAKSPDKTEMAFRHQFNKCVLRSINSYLKYMYGCHLVVSSIMLSQSDHIYKLTNFGNTSLFAQCYNFPKIKYKLIHAPDHLNFVRLAIQEKMKTDPKYRVYVEQTECDPVVPYPETVEELCDIPITAEQQVEYENWLNTPYFQFVFPMNYRTPDYDKHGKPIPLGDEQVDWSWQMSRVMFHKKLASRNYPPWPGVVIEPPAPVKPVEVETSTIPIEPAKKVWDTPEFEEADFIEQLTMMVEHNRSTAIPKTEYCFDDEDDCGGKKIKYETLSFDPSTTIFPKEVIYEGMTLEEAVEDKKITFEDRLRAWWHTFDATTEFRFKFDPNPVLKQSPDLSVDDIKYADREEYLKIMEARASGSVSGEEEATGAVKIAAVMEIVAARAAKAAKMRIDEDEDEDEEEDGDDEDDEDGEEYEENVVAVIKVAAVNSVKSTSCGNSADCANSGNSANSANSANSGNSGNSDIIVSNDKTVDVYKPTGVNL